MKSLAVAVILILLLTEISDVAGKRRKGGKRGIVKKVTQLNSSLKPNSTRTDVVNGTTAPPSIIGTQRLEIVNLKKKSSLTNKKLKSCQSKVKQAKTCRHRMGQKTKEMDQVVQQGHEMKRKMASLEEKVAGLKEVMRKEKVEAEILLHEKLSEMKVEYQDRIMYLETIVAGLNHSLIFQQKNAKMMEKTMRASSNIRITHLRSRYNARITNFEWTIKTLNKTIKKITREHSVCLNKVNPEIAKIDTQGKFPRTPPMLLSSPKLKPKKTRPKNPQRVTISPSLTSATTPTTQTMAPRTSSKYVTTKGNAKENLPTEYDETTVGEDTTIDVTTDLETTDMMTTVDITTDLMTSDDVTTYIMTPDPFISGDGGSQDDVIMKMM